MSNGGWLRYVKIIAIFIFTILLIADLSLGILSQYQTNRRDYREYQKAFEADQAEAAQEIARRCSRVFVAGEAIAACIEEAFNSYSEKETANRDLEAQQDMAFWSLWMFVVGSASLVVSIGGLVMLRRSLKHTQDAISNDREIGHAQVRAYLSIDIPTKPLTLREGDSPKFILHAKNTGQSPARKFRYIAGLFIDVFPLPDGDGELLRVSPESEARGSTLAAGEPQEIEATSDDDLTMEDIRATLRLPDKRIYVAAILFYRDVFGQERRTRFCAYLNQEEVRITPVRVFNNHRWILADRHNDET